MEKVIFYFLNFSGIYHLNDGCCYEGEFTDDKIEGYGKFMWTDNKIYEGEWVDNCIHGFGIFIKKGKTYIGNFVKDRKNGLGLYYLNNGNILVGTFINGEFEGLCIIFSNLEKTNEQICFMLKSKVDILITDENEKKNIKFGIEYKQLLKFYEQHKNLIAKYQILL